MTEVIETMRKIRDDKAKVAEVPTPSRRFLHVVFLNGSERWYELDTEGWRFDAMTRELIIGKGKGRKHIPLDNVEYYSPE